MSVFHRTAGCKLSCRLHMKAEDSGYTGWGRWGESREKQIRRSRRASAFILNPAGGNWGLPLWERQLLHTQSKYTECSGRPLKLRVWSLTTTKLTFQHSKRSCATSYFLYEMGHRPFHYHGKSNHFHCQLPANVTSIIPEWGQTRIIQGYFNIWKL